MPVPVRWGASSQLTLRFLVFWFVCFVVAIIVWLFVLCWRGVVRGQCGRLGGAALVQHGRAVGCTTRLLRYVSDTPWRATFAVFMLYVRHVSHACFGLLLVVRCAALAVARSFLPATLGQNWGFPTYNWEEMAKNECVCRLVLE